MRNADGPLVLNVRGGGRLCVPGSVAQISTYILLEQEDWFEDEIRFVRRWLRPGMRAVDVGANVGVYTIAMARAVGSEGRVWAFEPTPESADYLSRSIEINGLANVVLSRAAISDREGSVEFRSGPNAELNAIGNPGSAGGVALRVEATTLDRMTTVHGWADVDLIKLDVEGHELAAVRGGIGFFGSASPLVMLEVRLGENVDLRALEPLLELGYDIYRLLPGPLTLVPFDQLDPADGFLLNLFACKRDRADRLAEEGYLSALGGAGSARTPAGTWARYVASAPYAAGFSAHWPAKASFFSSSDSRAYHEGLAAYARSREPGLDLGNRIAHLARAYQCVAEAKETRPTLARRMSFARLAWELGLRDNAVDALRQGWERIEQDGASAFEEPFLAPSPRYEELASAKSPEAWLKCAVIEQYERLRDHSSGWRRNAPTVVEPILGLPYCSAEMVRRRQLVRILAGEQSGPERAPLLCAPSEENLNPEFWCGAAVDFERAGEGGTQEFSFAAVVPDLPRVKIVDVGAMSLGEIPEPYAALLRTLRCEVVGFEALADECEKLNQGAPPGRSYLPYVVGDGTDQTFYECSASMTSSLLEPNAELIGMFHGLEELLRIVSTKEVRTRRLDDIAQARDADMLKIDVQGAELMVLRGALALLQDVLVVHTEVEFVPLYKRQPLFAEIDAFLRAQGFVLHKLREVSGRPFKSLGAVGPDQPRVHQFLWCDAVYARDFMTLDSLSPEKLLRLAAILHENYGSHDFAALALEAYDRKARAGLHQRYLRALRPSSG